MALPPPFPAWSVFSVSPALSIPAVSFHPSLLLLPLPHFSMQEENLTSCFILILLRSTPTFYSRLFAPLHDRPSSSTHSYLQRIVTSPHHQYSSCSGRLPPHHPFVFNSRLIPMMTRIRIKMATRTQKDEVLPFTPFNNFDTKKFLETKGRDLRSWWTDLHGATAKRRFLISLQITSVI